MLGEVVDLLSDSDGEDANSSTRTAMTKGWQATGEKENANSTISAKSDGKCLVNNPYKKKAESGLRRHIINGQQLKDSAPQGDSRTWLVSQRDAFEGDCQGVMGETHLNGRANSKSSAKITRVAQATGNPYKKKRKTEPRIQHPGRVILSQQKGPAPRRELQAGLVFEEDENHARHHEGPSLEKSAFGKTSECEDGDDEEKNLSAPRSAQEYALHQSMTRISHNLPPILYHDPEFVAGSPSAIDGVARGVKSDSSLASLLPPKCKCRRPCKLAYSAKAGPNHNRPYHICERGKSGGCNYFAWAFTSHMLHWYRFGPHNGHRLKPDHGFCAEDLVQGKVGDCWFLSALAVVAERDDLINRLIGSNTLEKCYGMIEVKLFVDGYWKAVIIDNFLPCLIDQKCEKEDENNIQFAIKKSLLDAGIKDTSGDTNSRKRLSSKFDPHSLADNCRKTLHEIHNFLHNDRFRKDPSYRSNPQSSFAQEGIRRGVHSSDLAYSKAKSGLWVQFIEKAYAKIHGSYRAISGGHVEEAFLDLTGAPTVVYNFDHQDFNPRQFWKELMGFRAKRLPMGCGTSSSQAGIVGMHAYSILDVREVQNVGSDFFDDPLVRGIGNVSGFDTADRTVRLLRVRNPHGHGEWRGNFSDRSPIWERLMSNKRVKWRETNGAIDLTAPMEPASPGLKRTMKNDGTFWIDLDSFLMGFCNVDVVLAFKGNHAKSFSSNFPAKKSNHRCTRAFELSAVGRQPGEEGPFNNRVELFVMCIQKTKRGASLGRVDRKKSYKVSDTGILVGELLKMNDDGRAELGAVDGRFFGLNRNGHIRLELDRSDPDKRLVVMPLSFGHPAATDDKRSFVVRFVADAPLLVHELSKPPELSIALQKFSFGEPAFTLQNAIVGTSQYRGFQRSKTVLMECRVGLSFLFKVVRVDCMHGGGGTVLLYLIVNEQVSAQYSEPITLSLEINCRGMVCRTADGLVNHEVISKGKKFEAAWRRFSLSFDGESRSRLLAAIVQGGLDYQMGSIKCASTLGAKSGASNSMAKFLSSHKRDTKDALKGKGRPRHHEEFGVFASLNTPANILYPECVGISKMGPYIVDDSVMRPSADQDLEAAILASVAESSMAKTADNGLSKDKFSVDLEKAIALSLEIE